MHLSDWVIEIAIIIFYPLLAILRFFLPLKVLNPHPRQRLPIVIVERWVTQNPLHIIIKWYLEKRGWRVYLVNFTVFQGDFATSAFALKRFLQINGLSEVILIGISLGSLTCLEYLQRLGGWEKVNKFIAIGAPFHGTSMVAVFFPFRSGRESFPKSTYLQGWENENLVNKAKIFSLYARYDELVPKESSLLEGVRNQEINVVGHNNLHVWKKETFEAIDSILK